MEYAFKSFVLLVLFMLSLSNLESQVYFNNFYKIENINPGIRNITSYNDSIFITISYLNSDFDFFSSILHLDENSITSWDFDNFNLCSTGLLRHDDTYYLLPEQSSSSISSRSLMKLNSDFSIQEEYNYSYSGILSGNSKGIVHNDNFYLLSLEDLNEDLRVSDITSIDINGEIEWTQRIGLEDDRTFPLDLKVSDNSELIISTGVFSPTATGRFGKLSKFDLVGDLIWEYKTDEPSPSFTAPFYVAPLSNGNFVQSGELHRPSFEKWNKPPILRWINDNGELIFDTIFWSEPVGHRLDILGLKQGRGDYFFAFGEERFSQSQGGSSYGWLFKMHNNGDMIWSKIYRHGQFGSNRPHYIADLVELENGDILTMGGIFDSLGIQNIWVMRLNETGCFGASECNDIPTSVSDVINKEIDVIKIFPNPASSILYLETFGLNTEDLNIEIYDPNGILLLSSEFIDEIKIEHLQNGIYCCLVYSNKTFTQTIIFIKN